MLKFDFMRNCNAHYNFGIFTDADKKVLGNTQYASYILHENRLLKKSLEEITSAYSASPNKFSLPELLYSAGCVFLYKCRLVIEFAHSCLSRFYVPVSISTNNISLDYYYADFNTNVTSSLFPTGNDGKATRLYLLHTLSTINNLLYVMNCYEKDDFGWWLKINYISYYYAIRKLQNFQQYLIQNKLLTSDISDFFLSIGLDNVKYIDKDEYKAFRSYVMHSHLSDKDGNALISNENLDVDKPLFGLVETCFDGMSYSDLKQAVISETTKISDILSQWLEIQKLCVKPLK
jgi:hypothetical protein